MIHYPVIDFHSHVLPGVDDGSKDIEMSVAMLREMKRQGVDLCVATPHYYCHRRSVDAFLTRREAAWQELSERLDDTMPKILLGAEVAASDRLLEAGSLEPLSPNGTNVLLLEMPFSQWTDEDLDLVSTLCLDRGFQIVLAHLERFLSLQKSTDILDRILRLPLCAQVNAEALIPMGQQRRMALRLFSDGVARVLGSDAHNLKDRAPNLEKGRKILKKHLGADALDAVDRNAFSLLFPNKTE